MRISGLNNSVHKSVLVPILGMKYSKSFGRYLIRRSVLLCC